MTNNAFNKDDLHSGYVVELRNGELRMVLRAGRFTKILARPDGNWNYLNSCWGDDLRYREYKPNDRVPIPRNFPDLDVVRVYGLVNSVEHYCFARCINTNHRPLLWERVEAEKLTLAEVCERLGYPVEIVAEK